MNNGKTAYVTGGMGGIGTSLCQRLHQDGFKVIAGCGPSRDHAKWLGQQADACQPPPSGLSFRTKHVHRTCTI